MIGQVDSFRITLRVKGAGLDPDRISTLLGCRPTGARRGRWSLALDSTDCPGADFEAGIRLLLSRLPGDPDLWEELSAACAVDLFCGLFMAADNRAFSLSAEAARMLAERHLPIGFDVYYGR